MRMAVLLAVTATHISACGSRSAVIPPSSSPVEDGWVRAPAGTFDMALEWGCMQNSVREQTVSLTHAFDISKTEVTWSQFEELMNRRPRCLFDDKAVCGGKHPVVGITWAEAAQYCNALSYRAALPLCYSCTADRCGNSPDYAGPKIYDCPGYRLPTAAEWEYTYRAGSSTALYNGSLQSCFGADANVDAIAWYAANSNDQPHVVEQKQANDWGLFDMAGNAAEFVHDHQSRTSWPPLLPAAVDPWGEGPPELLPGLVLVRGGSFNDEPNMLQACSRLSVSDEAVFASNVTHQRSPEAPER